MPALREATVKDGSGTQRAGFERGERQLVRLWNEEMRRAPDLVANREGLGAQDAQVEATLLDRTRARWTSFSFGPIPCRVLVIYRRSVEQRVIESAILPTLRPGKA